MMSTERLARACARRPWTTLAAWVLALVLGIATIVALLDLTSEGELTSNPESERGYEAIGRHFPPDPNEEYVNELILVVPGPRPWTTRPSGTRSARSSRRSSRAESPTTRRASTSRSDASLVSADRSATLIPVGLRGDCEAGAATLSGIVEGADGGGFDVFLSGECSADNDLNRSWTRT